MRERWLSVPGWEGIYEASSRGRVRSIDRKAYVLSPTMLVAVRRFRGTILKQQEKRGYLYVALRKDGKVTWIGVHRVVLMTFHGRPQNGQQARHLDGDRKNNRPNNLAWGTVAENVADRVRHGSHKGVRNGRAKLSDQAVRAIRRRAHRGETGAALAREFGVSRTHVYRLLSGAQR